MERFFSTALIVCVAFQFSLIDVAHAQDIVLYVGPGGTNDSNCGRSLETPCLNVETILDQSPLFNDSSNVLCYSSSSNDDGRSSTTLYFLEGESYVPSLCLENWINFRIAGYTTNNVVIRTDSFGGPRSFFSFRNCTNVVIENLTFETQFPGKAVVYVESAINFTMRGCYIPVTAFASEGVYITASSGVLTIDGCTFVGSQEYLDRDNPTRGLFVSQGLNAGNGLPPDADYKPFDLLIRNCLFTDISSAGDPIDSYVRSDTDGMSVLLVFYNGATNNVARIQNCNFTQITNTRASNALVNYGSSSVNNTVEFTDCLFYDNRVRYGGGITAYFYSGPEDSTLIVERCQFLQNEAFFEGGAISVVFITNQLSNKAFISSCNFTSNFARYGSAIFFFNNPAWFDAVGPSDAVALPLAPASISDCNFRFNAALLTEGVINALRMDLVIQGETLFNFNFGSSILLRLSLLSLSGNASFESGMAALGGAINALDRSHLDMSGVELAVFQSNYANLKGGAIHADESSSSFSQNEYNHTRAQNRFGFCFATLGNERGGPSPTAARFIFYNNRAFSSGDNIYAFSLRGCVISNFVPPEIADFLLIRSDQTVQYLQTDRSILGSTSTGPVYLYFYGASTKCYKPVGQTTYLLPNCSHDLLSKTFNLNPDLQCGLNSFLNQIQAKLGPGSGLRPSVNQLLYPWAGIETTWTDTPNQQRLLCNESNPSNLILSPAPGEQFDLTIQLADQLLNYVSSTVYLTIEQDSSFSLLPMGVLIQLNGIQYAPTDRVFFTPNRALSGLSLVGLPGTSGRIIITVDSQIRGQKIELLVPFQLSQCPLGYINPPGATTIDEVNALISSHFQTTQRIPAGNPLACLCSIPPPDVREAITTFIPKFSSRATNLIRTCLDGYTVQLSSLLWAGYIPTGESHRNVDAHLPTVQCPNVSIPDNNSQTLISDSLTFWIAREQEQRAGDGSMDLSYMPVDVVAYPSGVIPGGGAAVTCFNTSNVSSLVEFDATDDGEFAIEFCTRGYCRGGPEDSWFLVDSDYPCIEHRQGVLCGQCEPGYSITMTSTVCKNCNVSDGIKSIPYLLSAVLGLLLVVVLVLFNVGASASVDSMLFFVQTVLLLLSGRTSYEAFQYLSVFNPDFTFNLCIVSSLSGLARLLLQYATPAYLMLLLLARLALAKVNIKYVSKVLGKHSFLKSVWLLILISYINLANITFELLHWRTIGPDNGLQRTILVHDPAIEFFHGIHLPFGIMAIVMALFIVVPFPFYMVALMCFPKIKPFTDVYSGHYRDSMHYWVFWSLFRRLFLVILAVFIEDFAYRHFFLLIGILVTVIVYVFTWPYKNRFDNWFGFSISCILLAIACWTIPTVLVAVDPYTIVSTLMVVMVLLIGWILIVMEVVLHCCFHKTLSEFFSKTLKTKVLGFKNSAVMYIGRGSETDREQELENSTSVIPRAITVDATRFREPLFDSDFGGLSESFTATASINTNSMDRRRRKGKKERETRGKNMPPRVTVSTVSLGGDGEHDSGYAQVEGGGDFEVI